jgi:hypothetical protein
MVIKDGNMSTPFRFKLRSLLYVAQHVYLLHNAKILMYFAYTNNKFNNFKTMTKYIIIHLSMFVILYVKISDALEF